MWVAAPSRPLGTVLVERIARGFARRGLDAVPLPAERLEGLRRRGILGPGQVVLLLRWRLHKEVVREWVDEERCVVGDCPRPPPWGSSIPVRFVLTLRARLFDGPSATSLGSVRLRRELTVEEGPVPASWLAAIAASAVLREVFPEPLRHRVLWVPVHAPRGRAVLSALRRGRFRAARLRAMRLHGARGPEAHRLAFIEAAAWLHDETVPWLRRRLVAERALERAEGGASRDALLAEAIEALRLDVRRHARWAARGRKVARVEAWWRRLWATRVPVPPVGYSERRPPPP